MVQPEMEGALCPLLHSCSIFTTSGEYQIQGIILLLLFHFNREGGDM